MKCKYYKICKEYNKESALCKEGGTWSYGKKANCWLEFYKKQGGLDDELE